MIYAEFFSRLTSSQALHYVIHEQNQSGITTVQPQNSSQGAPPLYHSPKLRKGHRSSNVSIGAASQPSQHHVDPLFSPQSGASGGAGLTPNPFKNPNEDDPSPEVTRALHRTMHGEYMEKPVNGLKVLGNAQKTRRRFFWVHPYTKMLHWSAAEKGISGVKETNTKKSTLFTIG